MKTKLQAVAEGHGAISPKGQIDSALLPFFLFERPVVPQGLKFEVQAPVFQALAISLYQGFCIEKWNVR